LSSTQEADGSDGSDQPAVDGDVRAGDIASAVAGRQQHQISDFLWAREAPRYGALGGLLGNGVWLTAARLVLRMVLGLAEDAQR
jgi:hypothetical protein